MPPKAVLARAFDPDDDLDEPADISLYVLLIVVVASLGVVMWVAMR